MVQVPVWAKLLCLGGFLVFGCSFIAMDLLSQQEQTEHLNCTEPQEMEQYGQPLTETETHTEVTGTITYLGDQTFNIHIENPNNEVIELSSHHSISPQREGLTDNETFVSTESEIEYNYQIQTDGQFRQSRVFEEFDGTGYFPIPETSPTIEYSIRNGQHIGTQFGMTGPNTEVRTEERGCHTVVLMNHGGVGSDIAFNEMVESMNYLEYERPYEYTYLFLVEYDVSPNKQDGYIGIAYEHTSWIEAGSIHSAEQNAIYHEYIHTRQYAHFEDNMQYGTNGMSESFAVYNDVATRQESNQISGEMEEGLFELRNQESDNPYNGADAYYSGAVLLYTLNQQYNIDVQEVETSCNGNYTEACMTEQIRTQDEEAAEFFTEERRNYSTTHNSPEVKMKGWLQLLVYSQYTTVLRLGILSLFIVYLLLKLRTVPWTNRNQL